MKIVLLSCVAVLSLFDIIRHPLKSSPELSNLGPAPELVGIEHWINSKPLTLQELRGKVVLIEFWTYSCINCLRVLPQLNHWHDSFSNKDLVIIGVHSPEFSFEKDIDNVQTAVERYKIKFPVAIDNNYDTWRAYSNRFWPTTYLIDKEGVIRKKHIGESGYESLEIALRQLLDLPPQKEAKDAKTLFRIITPEIHLGFHRANNYTSEIRIKENSTFDYTSKAPGPNEVSLSGSWLIDKEAITAMDDNCSITLNFLAGRVYLVATGNSPKPLSITLDGAQLPKQYFTKDMDSKGQIFITEDRKYDLIDLHGHVERHTMTISVPPKISLYEFSFGFEE